MKKLMAFFAAFLLVFTQGVAAFEQSPLSYATGGALQGNTIKNGEVQILSDAEMAEVEGEFIPLAIIAGIAARALIVSAGKVVIKEISKNGKKYYDLVEKGTGKTIKSDVANTAANTGKANNLTMNVGTRANAEATLRDAGFKAGNVLDKEKNIVNWTKGNETYTLRDYSKSFGKETTMDYIKGDYKAKTRF